MSLSLEVQCVGFKEIYWQRWNMIFIVRFLLVINPFISTVGASPPITESAMLDCHFSTVVSMESLSCC